MRNPKVITIYRLKRNELGMSRKEVITKTGLSKSYVEKIENGVRKPGIEALKKLSKVYKCKIDDLVPTA